MKAIQTKLNAHIYETSNFLIKYKDNTFTLAKVVFQSF